MGLVKIIPQDTLPENPGVAQLIDGGTCILSVDAGEVTFGSNTITYTSSAGNLPSDQVIFDLWEPVAGGANGASGPAIVAPIIVDDNNDVLYPAIS
tara:strand:+ start:185 stop:472 length:288 start_codon:yes stop_codon:yes gene_type:complete